MSLSPKSASTMSARADPARSRLNAAMPCDTAFRILARRYLSDLSANREDTGRGHPAALHQMRVALTRLRTSILLFSPMVCDTMRTQIWDELKWLNTRLGDVRDLDVVIERLETADGRPSQATLLPRLEAKRVDNLRRLARALGSPRYRRLMVRTLDWIESGPWSTARGKKAAKQRAAPIGRYSTRKLARWEEKLLKKCRKLSDLNAKKRHRLRIFNKRLNYSIEAFEDLSSEKAAARYPTALKYLRKAQKRLGQLNDNTRVQSLAAAVQQEGDALQFLGFKKQKKLLRMTAKTYRKLAALEPFRS